MKNKNDLTNFASTVLESFGINKAQTMNDSDKNLVNKITKNGKREKALLFHADAVPSYVIKKCPELFENVRKFADTEVEFKAVMPSITPVCFGAMFSGAYPENNGIPQYAKPILSDTLVQPALKVKTIVDLFTENGLKVALITCSNGCIASMLHQRGADAFIIPGDNDEKMFDKALSVLESGEYDVIMLYQLSYDYKMHDNGPESEIALSTLNTITERFKKLCEKAEEVWSDKKYLRVFNSDHGCHVTYRDSDGKTGGDHGQDISEDMDLIWFFGCN